MEWLEILLEVPVQYVTETEAIANMSVGYGIYTEDYSDLEENAWEIAHIDLIDEELLKKDRNRAIIHIYFSTEENIAEAKILLEELLTAADIPFKIETSKTEESEWRDNWKAYFKVSEIGQKLVIVPKWEEYNECGERKKLLIDPGAAFGTGTHATTSMCLELIEDYCENASVLDVGCGSGILGIGAALLGAESVLGVDIDPVAVKVAKENAEMNGVAKLMDFTVGDLTEKVSGMFDVVCANIVADAIIELLKNIKNFLKNNGVFVCSGIIDTRAAEVENAFADNGYKVVSHSRKDNWHAYLLSVKEKN